MAKRILLAGVLGGLALFMWGGLAHTVLGLGTVGIQNPAATAARDGCAESLDAAIGLLLLSASRRGREGAAGESGRALRHHDSTIPLARAEQ